MPHLHEKIDFTVSVFIVFNSKVLLRKHEKYNLWLGVGGHIELNEDPNQAAVREVKEEVGLDVVLFSRDMINSEYNQAGYKELIVPRFLNRHEVKPGHEHIDLCYFAKATSDYTTEQENEKSQGLKWFTLEELNDPTMSVAANIVPYAQAALNEVH